MAKTIRTTGKHLKVIRDTSDPLAYVRPAAVEAGLGAEASDRKLEEALAPITLFAIRSELLSRLQSSGGRPALAGTSRRAKIPLGDAEWADLEKLAAAVSGPGFCPSAGQIASVLLSLSVQSVASQVARAPKSAASLLARDLAARAAAAPGSRRSDRGT
jgi:hypothetical protein